MNSLPTVFCELVPAISNTVPCRSVIAGHIGENMENEDVARQAEKHKAEATRLLRESQKIHNAAKSGELSEADAVDVVIKLNYAAVDEAEKAFALEKEHIDGRE